MQELADGVTESIDGMEREAAVEALVAADPERDPERVRAALTHVTDEEGVVSREAVEAALTDASMVVQTAEMRAELLDIDFDEAREAAAAVPDYDGVATRLSAFAAAVDEVDAAARELTEDLAPLRAHTGKADAIYAVAQGCRDVTEAAQAVTRQVSDLRNDLEVLERWLATHEYRVGELDADITALAAVVEELESDADAVATSSADAAAWADATLRHRTAEVLVADVRAEAEMLRDWPDVEGPLPDLDAADERIGELAGTVQAVGEALADARAALDTGAYEGITRSFEATATSVDPPVEWATLQTHLESAQDRIASVD
jgi:chromosome segregation ATPase